MINNFPMWIYLADVADSLDYIFSTATFMMPIVCTGAGIIASMMYCDTYDGKFPTKAITKFVKWFAVIYLVVLIGVAAIPSSKTIYMMLGAKMTTEVIQTEELNKVKKIINLKLDEMIKESEAK